MANRFSVFVSSSCHELRDLRAAVRDLLRSMEIEPQLSEDPGFPRTSGDKPHVTCLRTLSDCPLVIGLLERKCGQPQSDWSPFREYNGLRPTHAELRHAVQTGKKLLLYIHASTATAYHQWQANPDAYAALAVGPEVAVLELMHELLTHDPAPYYETFGDASDVLTSLRSNLFNEIYASLKEQEARNRNEADYLMDKILNAAPEIKAKIQAQLSPDIVEELQRLTGERNELEGQLADTRVASQASFDTLQQEKALLDARIVELQTQTRNAQMMLTIAATRDLRWLEFVRTTYMPKQPGRVPFHNSAEVELRGYHAGSGARKTPILREVTWSKLEYSERGLHRGYRAGIIFTGDSFVPGVTWTYRRIGDVGPPSGNQDYFWRLPNIYFGDYLEVSTSDDEIEAPLSWRGYEFMVKNPEGRTSEWIAFSYPFDDEKLLRIMRDSAAEGRRLVRDGDNEHAVEPLRKAMVFADRIYGIDAVDTVALRKEWNAALDNQTLDKLRFPIGTRVRVVTGEHAGKVGTIESLGLRQTKPYWISTEGGDLIAAADDEVEPISTHGKPDT